MTGWTATFGPEDLTDLAPDATAAFARVVAATASVDLDARGPTHGSGRGPTSSSPMFASLDDDQRASVAAALGADLFSYVVAVWVSDMDARLRAAWAHLTGTEPAPGRVVLADPGIEAWPAVDEFLIAVSRLDQLDPVTTEVVRLRGARANNCRLCRSLRNVHAIGAGADEATFDAIDRYEASDLAEPLKIALRVTDAVLWTPSAWPVGVVDDVRRWFAPSQAVELVYDIARNAANRIAVALGADEAHVADGVEYFAVDADGALSYGLPAPG